LEALLVCVGVAITHIFKYYFELVKPFCMQEPKHRSKQGKGGVALAKSVVAGFVVDGGTDDLALLVVVEAASYFGRVPLRMFE